jgi:hypothetical protein
MSQQDKQEAAEKASRAATQAKHAVNNAGGAAEAAAEHVKDEVVEATSRLKDGAEVVAKKAVYTEAGRGFVALGIGLVTIAIGFKKLGEAKQLHNTFLRQAAALDHHVVAEG